MLDKIERRKNIMSKDNPFKITTPEDLTAEEAVKLFVDVFTDFYQITDPGHVLMKGPRGTGKSMMLRYLEPDCQSLAKSLDITQLPFIAIYIPLKNTNFSLAELKRFDNKHANAVLNEHLMITHCLLKVFTDIRKSITNETVSTSKILDFYQKEFVPILELELEQFDSKCDSNQIIDVILRQLNGVYRQIMSYIKKSAFVNEVSPYPGVLYDYNDYLVPLMNALSNTISQKSATIYLLLDDAHFLSDIQTKILNTWVSSRSSRKLSLKISTQYNYKTYYTINGATIDTPHDYTELDIATIYTERNKTNKSTYYRRISDIVRKRLDLCGINVEVEDFFPVDKEQEEEIKLIEKEYIERYDSGNGFGYNRTDDAKRYARPDFIKNLGGTRKSSHTYSYAGFDQLVNISSGVVRYFLQQAHTMFAKQQAILREDELVLSISPSVQNTVVRDMANKALFNELESYTMEGHDQAYPKEDIQKLSNLIQGLGALFRKNMLSEKRERRVFSIAISDTPSQNVERIFEIGVQLGYFHKSTIGRKNSGSIGRIRLYVLNRRLAPIWNLDPNGFAGYLFLKNKVLEDAILDPISTVKYFDGKHSVKSDNIQLTLFDMQASVATESEGDEINEENEDT